MGYTKSKYYFSVPFFPSFEILFIGMLTFFQWLVTEWRVASKDTKVPPGAAN